MYYKLQKVRKENGYNMADMAKALNISKAFYCQLENGKRRLNYEMAIKIAKVFQTKPDELFYEDFINSGN